VLVSPKDGPIRDLHHDAALLVEVLNLFPRLAGLLQAQTGQPIENRFRPVLDRYR